MLFDSNFPTVQEELKSYAVVPFSVIVTNKCSYDTGQDTCKQWNNKHTFLN
jgi:hypothetical protein